MKTKRSLLDILRTFTAILALIIFIFAMLFISFSLADYSAKTDLEIYTEDNIYYINGLIVTNESDDEVLVFDNKKELKDYISKITVKSLKSE